MMFLLGFICFKGFYAIVYERLSDSAFALNKTNDHCNYCNYE